MSLSVVPFHPKHREQRRGVHRGLFDLRVQSPFEPLFGGETTPVTWESFSDRNTFYTIAQDKKSTNQNSGVRFDATNNNGQKDTYYGYI